MYIRAEWTEPGHTTIEFEASIGGQMKKVKTRSDLDYVTKSDADRDLISALKIIVDSIKRNINAATNLAMKTPTTQGKTKCLVRKDNAAEFTIDGMRTIEAMPTLDNIVSPKFEWVEGVVNTYEVTLIRNEFMDELGLGIDNDMMHLSGTHTYIRISPLRLGGRHTSERLTSQLTHEERPLDQKDFESFGYTQHNPTETTHADQLFHRETKEQDGVKYGGFGATQGISLKPKMGYAIMGGPGSGKTIMASKYPTKLYDWDSQILSTGKGVIMCNELKLSYPPNIMEPNTIDKISTWLRSNPDVIRMKRDHILLVHNERWALGLNLTVIGQIDKTWWDDDVSHKVINDLWVRYFPHQTLSQAGKDFKTKFPLLNNLDSFPTWDISEHFEVERNLQGATIMEKHFLATIDTEPWIAKLHDGMVADDVPHDIIDCWEDTDFRDDNTKNAPTSNVKLQSGETAIAPGTVYKVKMTKWPMQSRPVLTKAVNREFNSVTKVLGSQITLRTVNLSTTHEIRRIKAAYFHSNAEAMIKKFQENPINLDAHATIEWLEKRPHALDTAKELSDILEKGFQSNRLNQVKVHTKLESLLKADPWPMLNQDPARIIVWQSYGICAIFAAVFLEAKNRLKTLLRTEIHYADGYRPDELCKLARTIPGPSCFFEDDLAKQDRQTDQQILDVEFGMYALLGVNPLLLSMWRSVHRHWRLKGVFIKGVLDGMRMTGQATTALGNVIVNMLVHADWVIANYAIILLMVLLWDDNSAIIKSEPSKPSRKTIAQKYNMQSSATVLRNHSTFLRMIIYPNSYGTHDVGPDYIRLRNRFEVTNGAASITPEGIEARCMSYAMWLGNTPEIEQIKNDREWPIEPTHWYDRSKLIDALANKYQKPREWVINEYNILVGYIKDPKPELTEIKILVNQGRKG